MPRGDKASPILYGSQDVKPEIKLPVTGIRWANKHTMITANTDGMITYWNTKNGLKQHGFKEEENNEIYTIDSNYDSTFLATGGKDCKIRIYDEDTYQLAMTLTSKEWTTAGHNNRIFGVKFIDDDSNLLLSGGWDQNIHIWDMRTKSSKATILGPKITGDSIDYQNGMILTGSNKMN